MSNASVTAQDCHIGEPVPSLLYTPHVNLIEGGQHGVGVLSILQSLCYPQPHPRHFHLQKKKGGGKKNIINPV